jgi:hypothetical protein
MAMNKSNDLIRKVERKNRKSQYAINVCELSIFRLEIRGNHFSTSTESSVEMINHHLKESFQGSKKKKLE